MEFLKFKDFANKAKANNEENVDAEYHFEVSEEYNGRNREEIDDLLYEYVCNYKCDEVYDELSLEELWSYIQEDNVLSEETKNDLGKYIDLCEESIKDELEIED